MDMALKYTINRDFSIRCFDAVETNAQYAELLSLMYEYSGDVNFQEFFFKDIAMLKKTVDFLKTKSTIVIVKKRDDKQYWAKGPTGEDIVLRAGKRFI